MQDSSCDRLQEEVFVQEGIRDTTIQHLVKASRQEVLDSNSNRACHASY